MSVQKVTEPRWELESVAHAAFDYYHGTVDATTLVTRLFHTVLGREPDPSGLAGYVAAFHKATTPAAIAQVIADMINGGRGEIATVVGKAAWGRLV